MTTAQDALVERLRDLITEEPVVREVSMFGGRSFMVNEKMIVSARKDGGLLVRVAADQHEELVDRRGAQPAEMGAGRDMGPGWIEVAAASITDDENLTFWFEVAMAYNRAVTGGDGQR